MKCVMCGRVMLHAAVTIANLPVGPKCARRAGLTKQKSHAHMFTQLRKVQRQEADQIDLFGEQHGHIPNTEGQRAGTGPTGPQS